MSPSTPPDHRVASPWAHVTGAAATSPSSPPPPPPSSAAAVIVGTDPESSEGLEGNGSEKKTAWSKPANGVTEVGPVMGAACWPALGESSKATVQKALSSDPIPAPPVLAPVVPNHHQVKPSTNNSNPNTGSRPQRPMRRGVNFNNNYHHGSMTNGGPVPPLMERPPQILAEKPSHEPSPRSNNNWDNISRSRGTALSPHSHGGPDHHRPFNPRGNNGPYNGGGRGDLDRMGYTNNPPLRHLGPVPAHGHHPRFPIMRSSPPPLGAAPPFGGPPPLIRSFVTPQMAFPEIPPHHFFYVPASPFFAAHHQPAHAMPPAMLVNPADTLRIDVLRQIEFYFSNENLVKDMYLRQKMDEQGWVSVTLIAEFNRVRSLTKHIPNNTSYILDLLRASELVEVQGEMIRRRGDWANWLPHSHSSHQRSPAAPNVDSVVGQMQNVILRGTGNHSSGTSSDR